MSWATAALLLSGALAAGSVRAEAIFGDGFEAARTCPAPRHFAAGRSPQRELHVAVDGSDPGGDGSPGAPFASLGRALEDASPGTAVVIHAGTYSGGIFASDIRGTAEAPMWIGGAPGEPPPLITGGATAIQLSRPAFLVLHDLEVGGATANGINIDDGGDVGDPEAARFVTVQRLAMRDVGTGGNQDCLKVSGLRDFWILDSSFENCGAGGSAVDFVGAHRGVVFGNRFAGLGSSGVQAKGGSDDIEIRANRFLDGGGRALNLGGSTGFEFFRPPLNPGAENFEARNIRAVANLIVGGAQAPISFVGCVDCLARNNTLVDPGRWLVRILQETVSQGGFSFAPARGGVLQNNLFLFRRADIGATAVNIGPGTDAASFRWQNNLFFATDAPADSAPELPGSSSGNLAGLDPGISGPGYAIAPDSPAAAAGITVDATAADLAGRCFAIPPAIGALEATPERR